VLFTANGHCSDTSVRAGKAMHAVSGRDTANATPERASKNATTSLGMHGFARPHAGVLSLCRLQ